MIVSHRHRFIFLAVPRTGTHAARAALAPFLGPEDWQQEALRNGARSPLPAIARIGHGHVTAAQARTHLPAEVWNGYFKFAVVRNPYDRFVSVCAMLNKRNPLYAGRETAFMKRALATPPFQRRVLVRPQARALVVENGARRLAVDFLGRYETLEASFAEACRRAGLPPPPLTRANAADHADYRAYYDDELVAIVSAFYADDFAALGYRRVNCADDLPCA